jgi:hypothetical protein
MLAAEDWIRTPCPSCRQPRVTLDYCCVPYCGLLGPVPAVGSRGLDLDPLSQVQTAQSSTWLRLFSLLGIIRACPRCWKPRTGSRLPVPPVDSPQDARPTPWTHSWTHRGIFWGTRYLHCTLYLVKKLLKSYETISLQSRQRSMR